AAGPRRSLAAHDRRVRLSRPRDRGELAASRGSARDAAQTVRARRARARDRVPVVGGPSSALLGVERLGRDPPGNAREPRASGRRRRERLARMSVLRWNTAGESHGKALLGILEGMPAGLAISPARVDAELARRQGGYGRGGRMKIERDTVELLAGTRAGATLGSPDALSVPNPEPRHRERPGPPKPRPGGAGARAGHE